MNYKIWLLNFISGDFEFCDESSFVKKNGFSSLAFNMAYKWAWNDLELQRTNNDGECCYVEYTGQ